MSNKGADQSARMRRLICVFVVFKGFPHRDPYDVEVYASWPTPGDVPVYVDRFLIKIFKSDCC